MKRIDWSTYPWWVRPSLAISMGLSIGLVIGGMLNVISVLAGSIMIFIVCALAAAFCIWALWDLHKMKRTFAYQVEQLEKTGRLPRGTLPQRRRHHRRWYL